MRLNHPPSSPSQPTKPTLSNYFGVIKGGAAKNSAFLNVIFTNERAEAVSEPRSPHRRGAPRSAGPRPRHPGRAVTEACQEPSGCYDRWNSDPGALYMPVVAPGHGMPVRGRAPFRGDHHPRPGSQFQVATWSKCRAKGRCFGTLPVSEYLVVIKGGADGNTGLPHAFSGNESHSRWNPDPGQGHLSSDIGGQGRMAAPGADPHSLTNSQGSWVCSGARGWWSLQNGAVTET